MAEKKLVVIGKINEVGIRRVLYREQITAEKNQVRSEKTYGPVSNFIDYLSTVISENTLISSGGSIDGDFMVSLEEALDEAVSNFQPNSGTKIRINIEPVSTTDDLTIAGRFHAKITANDVEPVERNHWLYREPEPTAPVFPEDWAADLLYGFEPNIDEQFTIPNIDLEDDFENNQPDLIEVRLMHTSTELVDWTPVEELDYDVPTNLLGETITLYFRATNAQGVSYHDYSVEVVRNIPYVQSSPFLTNVSGGAEATSFEPGSTVWASHSAADFYPADYVTEVTYVWFYDNVQVASGPSRSLVTDDPAFANVSSTLFCVCIPHVQGEPQENRAVQTAPIPLIA